MLEDFDWDAQPTIRQQVAQLASSGFLLEARNVVPLASPARARSTWLPRSGSSPPATDTGCCSRPRRIGSTAPPTPAARPAPARARTVAPLRADHADEIGYLPFEQGAATLFQLVFSRYEHASLIPTSNLPYSGWGSVYGDRAVAAAMIDRIVNHADVLSLKGASHRLRERGIDSLPSICTTTNETVGQTARNRPLFERESDQVSSIADSVVRINRPIPGPTRVLPLTDPGWAST